MWKALFGSAAGSAAVGGSASTSGGNLLQINQEWQYAIRYDKNVSDHRHGNVYDDDDLEDGIFALPHESIASVGIFYSRFLESEFMGSARKEVTEQRNIEINSKEIAGMDVSSNGLARIAEFYNRWYGTSENCNEDSAVCGAIQDFFSSSKSSDMAADAVLLLEGAKLSYNALRDLSWLSHHYIVVETTNGMYYSFDKFCDYIDVRRDSNKTAITHMQPNDSTRKNVRFAEKMGWMHPHQPMKLSDLVPFLRFHMHEPYHLLRSNCQKFARELWEAIAVPPNKRGKNRGLIES